MRKKHVRGYVPDEYGFQKESIEEPQPTQRNQLEFALSALYEALTSPEVREMDLAVLGAVNEALTPRLFRWLREGLFCIDGEFADFSKLIQRGLIMEAVSTDDTPFTESVVGAGLTLKELGRCREIWEAMPRGSRPVWSI